VQWEGRHRINMVPGIEELEREGGWVKHSFFRKKLSIKV
jgi:hypothetical protein